MELSRMQRVMRWLSPTIVTGPIFGKELRVSSRRRRNYVLRFIYPVLLLTFVVLVWLRVTDDLERVSRAYLSSRMGKAGVWIALTVAWFQFIAAQLVAIILASSAVSEEIYSNTLPVLMTTPVNGLQIVVGKLLSRLWQLLILLAISLPVLALVRVFGGVPWGYLIATLSITLATVLFYASVSLLMSVYCRRAYGAILTSLLVGAILFLILPMLAFYVANEVWGIAGGSVMLWLAYANPYVAMFVATELLLFSGGGAGVVFHWPLHCLIMLACSVGLIAVSAVVVRRAALAQVGGMVRTGWRWRRKRAPAAGGAAPEAPARRIRRVGNVPVLWRELRLPTFRGPVRKGLMVALLVAGLAAAYGIAAHEGQMEDGDTHLGFIFVYVILAGMLTNVFAATTITTEKESRCWPLLLATPMSAAQIVMGKAAGVLRRTLPAWGLLFGHLAVFTFAGMIHPIVWVHLGIIASWLTVFLTGTGLFFSSLVRRTTTAVVLNLSLALGLWLLVPLVTALATGFMDTYGHDPPALIFMLNTHPMVQVSVVCENGIDVAALGKQVSSLRYRWPYEEHNAPATTLILLGSAFGYGVVGLLLAAIAGARFRKRVF